MDSYSEESSTETEDSLTDTMSPCSKSSDASVLAKRRSDLAKHRLAKVARKTASKRPELSGVDGSANFARSRTAIANPQELVFSSIAECLERTGNVGRKFYNYTPGGLAPISTKKGLHPFSAENWMALWQEALCNRLMNNFPDCPKPLTALMLMWNRFRLRFDVFPTLQIYERLLQFMDVYEADIRKRRLQKEMYQMVVAFRRAEMLEDGAALALCAKVLERFGDGCSDAAIDNILAKATDSDSNIAALQSLLCGSTESDLSAEPSTNGRS